MISTIVLSAVLILLLPCTCGLLFTAISDHTATETPSPPISMGTSGPTAGYVGHPLNEPGTSSGTGNRTASAHLQHDDWNAQQGSGTMLSSVVAADYPSWHVDSGTAETKSGKDIGWLLRLESPDHAGLFVDVHYDRVPGTDDWSPSGWKRRGDEVFGGAAGRATGEELLGRFAEDYAQRPLVVTASELKRTDDGTRSFRVTWRQPNEPRDLGSSAYVLSPSGTWSVR